MSSSGKLKNIHFWIGILLILGAALMFALMNLFVNLSGDLPTMQKVFFRNLVAALIAGVALCFEKEKFRIHSKESLFWLFLRAISGFLGVILNFYAIDHIGSISDASILNKLSPFFAIAFSAILLKEKPKPAEVVFVIIAFVGAIFVVRPGLGAAALPAVAGFASGACAGFAYTCVRILGLKGERAMMTVFFFSAFSTLVSLPFLIFSYEPMTALQLTYLILAGVSAAGGQFFITAAYRHAPAKEIAVFDYFQVLFAAVLGYFFLTQVPDIWSVVGYVIIIGAAVGKYIYTLHFKKSAHETQKPLAENGTDDTTESNKKTDVPENAEESGESEEPPGSK